MPKRQPAKIKALQQTIKVVRAAISTKHWNEARYALSRARALTNALPANLTVQEREQLSALRKKYAARNTPAARNAKQAKATPAKRPGGKKAAPKKSAAKSAAQQSKPTPVRELGDRFISRASLGYGSKGGTNGSRAR
ncbi:hypothetical protein ACWDF1_25950 [Streptomyces coelicoflavus]|uniref:hypothetical protein n=1 Tax=Streptomyces coelicoflavus TaxID=285562 RepID=UPI0036BFCDEF